MIKNIIIWLIILSMCLISSCDLLKLPFQLLGEIIQFIPKLLMLSDSSGEDISPEAAEQILANIDIYIKNSYDKNALPKAEKILSQLRKKIKISSMIFIDPREKNAKQKIREAYKKMRSKGRVYYIMVDTRVKRR